MKQSKFLRGRRTLGPLAMMVSCALPVLEASAFQPLGTGDLDQDGRVSVLDVARLVNHLREVSPLTESQLRLADINGDQVINQRDAELLASMAAGVNVDPSTRLAARSAQMVALKRDSSRWAWGQNTSGQLGDGTTANRSVPGMVDNGSQWRSVTLGATHGHGIKEDGTLWGWGNNAAAQLGNGTRVSTTLPVQIGTNRNWYAVVDGGAFSLCLDRNGTLWAAGNNLYGQLGAGDTTDRINLVQIGGAGEWVNVAAGDQHVVAVKRDGSLWAWGSNANGQTGGAVLTAVTTPTRIGAGTNWTALAAGAFHSLAVQRDGSLWAWGQNIYGQLGVTNNGIVTVPARVGTDNDWTSVASSISHSLGLKRDGSLWAWGANSVRQLGDGTITSRREPMRIGAANNWVAVAAAAFSQGSEFSAALAADGTLATWGANASGQLGSAVQSASSVFTRVSGDQTWATVRAGAQQIYALGVDSTLWGFGRNDVGQLGDGSLTEKSTPSRIGDGADWTQIGAGDDHCLALRAGGTLWSWGYNGTGQLGDGTTNQFRNTPVQIGSDTDWQQVAGGTRSFNFASHSLAIKTDGSLWAWGRGNAGELGIGVATNEIRNPVRVGGGIGWRFVQAGSAFSAGIRTDGTLWTWGTGSSGQLGIGLLTNFVTSPVQVGTDSDWRTLSAGSFHVMAVRNDGSLWGWGLNTKGQVGFATNFLDRPQRIGTDNDWVAVASGSDFSFALKADGSLWATGNNNFGRLGLGVPYDQFVGFFTRVPSPAAVAEVSAGRFNTVVRTTDGNLWTTGDNTFGQLGNNSLSLGPLAVGGATDWGVSR